MGKSPREGGWEKKNEGEQVYIKEKSLHKRHCAGKKSALSFHGSLTPPLHHLPHPPQASPLHPHQILSNIAHSLAHAKLYTSQALYKVKGCTFGSHSSLFVGWKSTISFISLLLVLFHPNQASTLQLCLPQASPSLRLHSFSLPCSVWGAVFLLPQHIQSSSTIAKGTKLALEAWKLTRPSSQFAKAWRRLFTSKMFSINSLPLPFIS